MSNKMDEFLKKHEFAEFQIVNSYENNKICTINDINSLAAYGQEGISVDGEANTVNEAIDVAIQMYEEEERALTDKHWEGPEDDK